MCTAGLSALGTTNKFIHANSCQKPQHMYISFPKREAKRANVSNSTCDHFPSIEYIDRYVQLAAIDSARRDITFAWTIDDAGARTAMRYP
jgi:hypothetical protein